MRYYKAYTLGLTVMSLFILDTSIVYGQLTELKEVNSYYMGKKNTLSLGLPILITQEPNKSQSKKIDYHGLNLNSFFQLNYTRAINNGNSVRFIYSRDETSRTSYALLGYRDPNGDSWYGEQGTPKYIRNSIGFTINGHFRNRGNLAPIGNFISVGARVHFIKSDFSMNTLIPSGTGKTPYSLKDHEQDYQYFTLDAGYTYRKMLSKSVFYDMGLNVALPLHTKLNPHGQESSTDRLNKALFDITQSRYSFTDFAGFYIGLGVVF